MNKSNLIIRYANKNDLNEIVNLKIKGWQTAYANIIDNEYLGSLKFDKEFEKFDKQYDIDTIIVAEKENKIVGFCRFYLYQDEEYDCEIREIYVDPNMKRTGIGRLLFSKALEIFKNENKKTMILGVFKENYGAREFYKKMNGVECGNDSMAIQGKIYDITKYKFDIL